MVSGNFFEQAFQKSVDVKLQSIRNGLSDLERIGDLIVESYQAGGTLYLCGNGGSAADAQHLAAEMLIRLRPHVNRQPFPALSLAQDTSTLTACGNDYSFDEIFARPLDALGKREDVLLAISTSGRSVNVLKACEVAKEKGMKAVSFLGGDGGDCLQACDIEFVVPSSDTAAIQECHITAGHALLEYVEDRLLGLNDK